MRINNNIAALNTYRQLTNNTQAGSKSLEKLSSGLRINKAGDDAAGLAISEKMRSQITGLDQATRNAQDGISLIQTAEGALGETHSILKRMRQLALQSATDTNASLDRSALQKELNQLTTEINRIGNTTEFNTKKLLNGGGIETELQVNQNVQGAGKAYVDGQVLSSVTAATFTKTGVNIKGVAAQWAIDLSTASTSIAAGTSAEADLKSYGTFTFGDVTVTLKNKNLDTTGTNAGSSAVEAGATKNAVTVYIDNTSNSSTPVTALTSAQIADAIVKGLNASFVSEGSQYAGFKASLSGGSSGTIIIKANGPQDSNQPINTGSKYNELKLSSTISGLSYVNTAQNLATKGVDAVRGQQVITFDKAIEMKDLSIDFKVADSSGGLTKTVTLQSGKDFAVTYDAKAQVAEIAKALNGNSTFSEDWIASADGNKLSFSLKADSIINEATLYAATVKAQSAQTTTKGESSISIDNAIEVGGRYIIDGQSIEVVADANDERITQGKAMLYSDDTVEVAKRLETAIKVNDQLSLKYSAQQVGSNIRLTQNSEYESMNSTKAVANTNKDDSFMANLQIGANYNQSMTVNIEDMRSKALNIVSTIPSATLKASDGAVASYTRLQVVSDGISNANTEYALDISDFTKASAAVSVLDDAIAKVSDQRSQLGAFQNRLEHTISNLGTSSENLTAAESRVRDVDMAAEMMTYTKNNILTQAAQAMLAQANQTPQGVLQLLQ